ncbi:hypothetical protein [Paenibacillus eucommiae]|uniref:Uncharacterized protein n=1 Tax=Paenibacillus eucommiae TaxID=1355755 RepID=A0ABS4J1Q2_9BACL|nr:hypothetical protein [Paenibacillus eucommiae]MBP1993720.1 hypothetical protein [Paenibacillus eucommiae]
MKQLIPYDIKIYTDINLGIFNPIQAQIHNSFLFNFKEKTKNDDIANNDYTILDVSNSGKLVALASKKWDNKNHNTFIVKNVTTDETIFLTNKYLVYQAYFSPNEDYLITSTYKNNGFCLKIGGDLELNKLPFSVGGGILYQNKYVTVNERKKSSLTVFDFKHLSFSEFIMNETKVTLQQVNTDTSNHLYTIDKNFVVRKHNSSMECVWETKFKKDDYNFCNCAPKFFIKESLDLLVFYAPNQKSDIKPRTYIGLRLSTGEKIEIENKGEDTGFIESIFFEGKVIDSFGTTLDLETGLTEHIFR